MNKELSMAQKIKYMKDKGTILKFKTPVIWKGEARRQIMTDGVKKEKKMYFICGTLVDSPAKSSLEELTEVIDWEDFQERLESYNRIRD